MASLTGKTAELADECFILGLTSAQWSPRCSWFVPLLIRLDCVLMPPNSSPWNWLARHSSQVLLRRTEAGKLQFRSCLGFDSLDASGFPTLSCNKRCLIRSLINSLTWKVADLDDVSFISGLMGMHEGPWGTVHFSFRLDDRLTL